MISVFQVLGGLALFLFGVHVLSSGMEKIAGHRLQEWLDRMTNRPIKGAVFGVAATAVLQSSSLLMVMMIGLINANLMTLEQSIGVMMGMEIGTTVTAQIIAFKMGDFCYLFIAIGFILYEFVANRKWQKVGEVILGFGVLFLGMQTMSGALKVLADLPIVQEWLAFMGQNYLTGILAGTIATAIIQSSSAITGLVVAMGISQVITLPGAIALLLGANLGTCVTGVVASLQLSPASKRAAIAQILHNGIGVLFFLPFLPQFANLVTWTSSSLPRQIANAHAIHNVVVSAVLFPFIKTIARVCERLVPKTEQEGKGKLTHYIDDSQYRFPDIALSEAAKELDRIGKITANMINLSRQAVIDDDEDAARQILTLEHDLINPVCAILEDFLTELAHGDISDDQTRRSFRLKEMITDVEKVSDLTWDIANLSQHNTPPRDVLGKQLTEELDNLFRKAHRTYSLALQAVRASDDDMAQMACNMDDEMDRKYWKLRKKFSKHVKAGKITPEVDTMFNEILRNLERISDHADSLGISVMRG